MYRVYEYGVTRILSGEDAVQEQLLARTRYWNRLVEIERDFQAAKEAVVGNFSEELTRLRDVVAAVEAKLEDAVAARSRLRSQERTRRVPGQVTGEIEGLRSLVRELRKRYRETRRAAFGDEATREALRTLATERTAVIRQARREHAAKGLWWGNYLDVELAYKTARMKAGNRLKFQRAAPEGRVSVWFQHGLDTRLVWGKETRLGVKRVPEEAWTSSSRATRRRLARTCFYLRVGTNPDRAPRLVEGELVMHRPLPHGLIRHASLVRERVASHWRHRLVITVAVEDKAPREDGRRVGVDIGWRLFKDRLRVAVAVDQEGQVEELALTGEMLGGFDRVRGLQAVRDQHFNEAKAWLAKWLRSSAGVCPDWLRDAAATIAQWRSQSRLAALVLRWRGNRFKGDDEAYDTAEAWRKKDKHLWEWQANLRDKLLGRRREMYRLFAIGIARRYGMVVIEDFDLRRVVQEEDSLEVASRMRFIAALSRMRMVLEHTCAREGVRVVQVPAEYTTQDCSYCGNREQFDATKEVRHTCSKCGEEWDQDENAARNLLKRAADAGVGGRQV